MQRVTLRVPEPQMNEVGELVDDGRYPNQSEAIRAAIRLLLDEEQDSQRSTDRPRTRI